MSKFWIKENLIKTQKGVHENIRPFECNICQAKFGSNGHLNRHIKGVHDKLTPMNWSDFYC